VLLDRPDYHVSGDPRQAIGYYRQVLAIGQELGDEQLTAIPSAMIGLALAVQGQWAQGRPAAQPSGAGPREVRHNVKSPRTRGL
jgi:hypothetical protein